MKATVIGAGFYGSTTAQRLIEFNIFDEVVLTDIRDGWAEGLALDINESSPIVKFKTKAVGQTTTNDGSGYKAIADSDVIVNTAGFPRNSSMKTRMDLIKPNAAVITSIAKNIKEYAPNSVIINVTNPLDEMTELFYRETGFASNKIMGQAGALDTARFAYFISLVTKIPVSQIKALTLGSHGPTMVPIVSQCFVDGRPLASILPKDIIEKLVVRTRDGGSEIVDYLKKGSAYYAPSAAAAQMAKAVATDSNEIIPSCVRLNGQYGIKDVFLGVEAQIGTNGVNKIIETTITTDEENALIKAAEDVKAKSAILDEL
jgi:malate dehydrogenase